MPAESSVIKIVVIYKGKEYVLETYRHEYRNLMALIYDRVYLENFGECKGTGRCGTCHIHILDYAGELLGKEGNENTTFSKMAVARPNSRLACQIVVDSKLHGLKVEVVSDEQAELYDGR